MYRNWRGSLKVNYCEDMVFRGKYDDHLRETIRKKRKKGLSISKLQELFCVSRSAVKRILKEKKPSKRNNDVNSGACRMVGRPRSVDRRSERKLIHEIQRFRDQDGGGAFTLNELRANAGLHHVPLSTIRRVLNRNNYYCLAARRKGMLMTSDLKKRYRFARKMKKNYRRDVWSKEITFYLDAKSFVYKRNPFSCVKNPKGRIWRTKKQGQEKGCTAKGSKTGTGGRNVHLLVCISHGHGVCAVQKYEKMNGKYFTSYVKRKFPVLFQHFNKTRDKLWIQDGDPSQNCKSARAAWTSLGAKLINIPPRSPDVNPIENVFHLAVKALNRDTEENVITSETYEQFVNRITSILFNLPVSVINKTIESVSKRIDLIIANKGKRLKY